MIGFDFAALSYIAPKENDYQYMLEGLDSEWQFTKGSNNHLSYANLPVGEYVLRIKERTVINYGAAMKYS